MAYKTPGVYIKEISTFPPSVAQVETAIPAFIGHTQKALDSEGNSISNKPTRITSMLEYEAFFGGEYDTESFEVKVDTTQDNKIVSVTPQKRRYYLYDALKLFYDNGGGPCYIVSVDSYENAADYAKLKGGLDQLVKFDEPTLILIPDSVGLDDGGSPDYDNFGQLQKDVLAQCGNLMDRFGIFDLIDGYLEESGSNKPISTFREKIGTRDLKYGAAYYPWLFSNYLPSIGFYQLAFKDEGDAAINDLTPFSGGDGDLEDLVAEASAAKSDFDDLILNIQRAQNMGLIRGTHPLKEYYYDVYKEIAGGSAFPQRSTYLLNILTDIALIYSRLDGTVNDGLQKEIDLLKSSDLKDTISELVAFEKNSDLESITIGSRTTASMQTIYETLNGTPWINQADYDSIPANGSDYGGGTPDNDDCVRLFKDLASVFSKLESTFNTFFDAVQHYEDLADNALFQNHLFFKGVFDNIKKEMSKTPPSGAIAGVYASVDSSRGVWKAPANVSLSGIIGPMVKLDEADQRDLNVHTTGKSINAIRAFAGKGIMVWGARTLAGNDNEWRYISVRRFYNMVEESVKKATEPFVFEPNDANTWVKVKAMIGNYLTGLWRDGAMMGAKPEEAFFVKTGLGETMTQQDVLEGRMIVEIGMAVVRPAEFIILRFSHKMAEG